jgi:hypothetical protein
MRHFPFGASRLSPLFSDGVGGGEVARYLVEVTRPVGSAEFVDEWIELERNGYCLKWSWVWEKYDAKNKERYGTAVYLILEV